VAVVAVAEDRLATAPDDEEKAIAAAKRTV
jgi:hypothetical protein